MAVAKKCKHCGEWLSVKEDTSSEKPTAIESVLDASSTSQTTGIEASVPVDTDIPTLANIAFWVAVIGAFIVMVHESGMNHGAGKYRVLFEIADWIPSWLGNLTETAGVIGLVWLLMQLAKKLGSPIVVLCGIYMAFSACCCVLGIVDSSGESGFSLAVYLITLFVMIVLGIKLITSYRNALRELGITFVSYPIVFFAIALTIVFRFANESMGTALVLFVLSVTLYYAFKECLISACYEPNEEGHTGILLKGGLGVLIAVVLFFIVTGDSSNSSSSENIAEDEFINSMADVNDNEVVQSNVTPQGVLSASDAIMLVKSGIDFIDNDEKREEFGYDGCMLESGELCWFKNCRITTDEYSTPIPVSAERNCSYAYIDHGCFIVTAYDYSVFESWLNQLNTLGYKETNRSDENYDITYTYEKNNNPTIWVYDREQEWMLWVSFNL